jgi:molybdenum cofactor biosynthesis protein B
MNEHPHARQTVDSVGCAVLTISDTRTIETDAGGKLIQDLLRAAGHRILHYSILPDDPELVGRRVRELCESTTCQAVLTTGGTGLAPRDHTYEAVVGLFDKRLEGFGELFRMLSYAEVGPAAMLSRAVAGLRGGTVIFSMPGTPAAVRLAMERLILPQLGHIAWLLHTGGT